MTILSYALPVAAALLLILFFTALPPLKTCALPAPLRASAPRRMDRWDWLIALALAALYALPAFHDLGDTAAPQTFAPMAGQSAVITLPEGAAPDTLMLYAGVGQGGYDFAYSLDGEDYQTVYSFDQGHVEVLKWQSLHAAADPAPRYIRVTCTAGTPYLGELVFLDADGAPIPVECTLPALCDEPDTLPASPNFHNSTYFDEIYHARTAWEHLNGVWPYEISHPPLGKELLALGILLFGMTPFGWRFMGTLFGVLMLPVLYVLLKKLFGGRWVPALGTVVFAADFLHFVQTRIATVDTYAVFFILLMYLFMYIWLETDSLRALFLCGLSFGLGAASKWTCLYAGAGLALLWAAHWLRQFLGTRKAKRPWAAFGKNVLFCLGVFVLLPGLIYYLAYLPYGEAKGCGPFTKEYLAMVLENQRFMYTYHSGIVAEHPYSSRWYQWIFDIRPILYYLEYFPDGTRSGICAFVSPALCWGGLLSLFVLLYTALFRRDRTAAFLLVGYLAQLLPWVFIRRLTFEYHYFAASAFLVLALSYVFALLRDNTPHWRRYAIGFAAACVLLFVLYYPPLSGTPYATHLLQWLPTWPV